MAISNDGNSRRNENERRIVANEHSVVSKPELRSIRIFKSVMGVPGDRKLGLESLMRNESFNMAK